MLTLFFVDDLPTTVGTTYEFNNDDALHAIRVLRAQIEDVYALSDGQGAWSKVRVRSVAKKSMTVEVSVRRKKAGKAVRIFPARR